MYVAVSMCCAVVLLRAVLNCCCNVHAMVRNDGFATSCRVYACFWRDYRNAPSHLTRLTAALHRSCWFGFISYSGGRSPTTEKGDRHSEKANWREHPSARAHRAKKPKVAPKPPNLEQAPLGAWLQDGPKRALNGGPGAPRECFKRA